MQMLPFTSNGIRLVLIYGVRHGDLPRAIASSHSTFRSLVTFQMTVLVLLRCNENNYVNIDTEL